MGGGNFMIHNNIDKTPNKKKKFKPYNRSIVIFSRREKFPNALNVSNTPNTQKIIVNCESKQLSGKGSKEKNNGEKKPRGGFG